MRVSGLRRRGQGSPPLHTQSVDWWGRTLITGNSDRAVRLAPAVAPPGGPPRGEATDNVRPAARRSPKPATWPWPSWSRPAGRQRTYRPNRGLAPPKPGLRRIRQDASSEMPGSQKRSSELLRDHRARRGTTMALPVSASPPPRLARAVHAPPGQGRQPATSRLAGGGSPRRRLGRWLCVVHSAALAPGTARRDRLPAHPGRRPRCVRNFNMTSPAAARWRQGAVGVVVNRVCGGEDLLGRRLVWGRAQTLTAAVVHVPLRGVRGRYRWWSLLASDHLVHALHHRADLGRAGVRPGAGGDPLLTQSLTHVPARPARHHPPETAGETIGSVCTATAARRPRPGHGPPGPSGPHKRRSPEP